MTRRSPVALLLLLLAWAAPARSAASLDGLDGAIRSAMEEWRIPGLSVGVLVDGEIVYLRGFGVDPDAGGDAVTPSTLFRLGNCSEPFTSFVIGGLVDQGRVDLDAPLRRYLPELELQDETRARLLTPRDLLAQRTGLPSTEIEAAGGGADRRALTRGVRELTLADDFRTTFSSSPWNVLLAEHLVERVVGRPWEEVVRGRVFGPLGMEDSSLGTEGPVGDVRTSAADALKWLRVLADGGVAGDRRFLERDTLRELIQPHVFVYWSRDRPFQPTTYGLFWGMNVYRGHYHARLGGFGDGFEALLSFFPEDRIGVVILANRGGDTLFLLSALKFMIADRLLGYESRDWIEWARSRRRPG